MHKGSLNYEGIFRFYKWMENRKDHGLKCTGPAIAKDFNDYYGVYLSDNTARKLKASYFNARGVYFGKTITKP